MPKNTQGSVILVIAFSFVHFALSSLQVPKYTQDSVSVVIGRHFVKSTLRAYRAATACR